MGMSDAKAGVMLVVEGLSQFKNNMGKATDSLSNFGRAAIALKAILQKLRPEPTLLERAFSSLGKNIKNFAQNIIGRILTIAFGVLVRDTIRGTITAIGNMIDTVARATYEFQRLEVRLNQFNLITLMEQGLSYNEAMEDTIALTKEQLGWTIKLAKSSPYDASDVTNAYTLARSYGFVDTKSKKLTDAILNFASGMGLENTAIERIITNMGQMVQQGKITGTELRDLARGSFVPVNKILGMVAKNIGVTTEELNKMRKAGTTDPQWFIDAFIQMVDKDFAGASEKMSQTLQFAIANLKDMFGGLAAWLIGSPVAKAMGKFIAGFVEAFSANNDERYNKLIAIFERIGYSITRIISKIFDFLPGVGDLADSLLKLFDDFATWLVKNEHEIVKWGKDAIDFFRQVGYSIKVDLIPWIKNELIPQLEKFGKWWKENGPLVLKIIKLIAAGWLIWEVAATIIRGVLGVVIAFIGPLVKLLMGLSGLNFILNLVSAVLDAAGVSLSSLLGPVLAIGAAIVTAGLLWALWGNKMAEIGQKIYDIIAKKDWTALGKLMVDGLVAGLMIGSFGLFGVVIWLAKTAMGIWNSFFKMKSPSKLMEESGINITTGLAKGMAKGAGLVKDVTNATANAIAAGLSGGGTGYGVTSSASSKYLSPIGDVIRSTATTTTGKDPCAKDSVGGCIADAIGSALSGVGDIIGGITDLLAEMTRNEAISRRDALEAIKDITVAMERDAVLSRRDSLEALKDLGTNYERYMAITRRDTLEQIKDSAITIEYTAEMKLNVMVDRFNSFIQDKALGLQTFMSNLVNKFLSLVGVNTGTSSSSRSPLPPTPISLSLVPSKAMSKTVGGNSTSVNQNITNNFSSMNRGQRVSFDYENSQFWL